jgi:hypothetical protein
MSSVTKTFSIAIGVGSALVLNTASGISNETRISISYSDSSNSPAIRSPSTGETSSLELMRKPHRKWNADANIRFKELARKDALEELTAEEWMEFDLLSTIRREAKFPKSADQILWLRKQKAVTQELLAALRKYAEFHKFES